MKTSIQQRSSAKTLSVWLIWLQIGSLSDSLCMVSMRTSASLRQKLLRSPITQ